MQSGIKDKKMTTMQSATLNAVMLRNMSIIAEDETLLRRVSRYLRRVVAEKLSDSAEVSKDEFFASLERGEEEYRLGKTHRIESVKELKNFLNAL